MKIETLDWDGIPSNETEPERQARIVREAVLIAQAQADIKAGLGIDLLDLDRWSDALDKDENAPPSSPRGIERAVR